MMQRTYRAAKARKILLKAYPAAAIRLAKIGRLVRLQKKQRLAAVVMQANWRGAADRKYARMKANVYISSASAIQRAWRLYWLKCNIDAWYDAGPAAAIKKLMTLMLG